MVFIEFIGYNFSEHVSLSEPWWGNFLFQKGIEKALQKRTHLSNFGNFCVFALSIVGNQTNPRDKTGFVFAPPKISDFSGVMREVGGS